MMDWSKRPMFRNAANMMGGGYVPLPRMQTGTGPGGVSPELFSPAEFMGSPLNEMAQAPGFFPQGNFGGGPSPSENAENEGILSGFADEEEMVDEVMPFQFPYTQELFDAAKTEALKLFDQGFKELMAIFQAEAAAGGVAAEEIEMTLDEELEVIEGQAEAQVKEMMDLPEEVDLIPAEVVENYREMAQTALFSPEMGAEPMMEEIPKMRSAGVVPGSVLEEEEKDPLAILEAQRAAATDRLDERKRIAAGEATTREQDLRDRIKRGEFSQVATDWNKLDKMVARVKNIAERKAREKSYYPAAASTMGAGWAGALIRKPRMAKLAGDEAALNFEIEIEKLKQAEQQAINSGDAGMLKNVYLEGQKIQDSLTNTLLGDVGDIEAKAITGVEDILTEQIGDTAVNAAARTDLFWRDELKKWPPGSPEYAIAEKGLDLEGVPSAPELANQQLEDMQQVFNNLKADYGAMTGEKRLAEYLKLYPWAIDEKGDAIPPDINLYPLLLQRAEAMLQRLYSSQSGSQMEGIVDARNLPQETIEQNIANGVYREGQILVLGTKDDGTPSIYIVPKTSP